MAEDRPIMESYYEFITQEPEPRGMEQIRQMKLYVKEDPDFLDPYVILYLEYKKKGDREKYAKYLNEAYARALHHILDKNGNWPDKLEWGWQENRHIIRTFHNRAEELYERYFFQEALELNRKLLKADPEDRTGVRFPILALRMGMSYFKYDLEFNWKDPIGENRLKWFRKHYMEDTEEWMDCDF